MGRMKEMRMRWIGGLIVGTLLCAPPLAARTPEQVADLRRRYNLA